MRGGRYSISLSWGWWSLTLISWRCYRWGGGGGRICLVHCPGVGGLGCRSDGDVTGERREILSFTELGLVVWGVRQMEMLQVRGGRYSASLSCGWWSGMSARWRCYR